MTAATLLAADTSPRSSSPAAAHHPSRLRHRRRRPHRRRESPRRCQSPATDPATRPGGGVERPPGNALDEYESDGHQTHPLPNRAGNGRNLRRSSSPRRMSGSRSTLASGLRVARLLISHASGHGVSTGHVRQRALPRSPTSPLPPPTPNACYLSLRRASRTRESHDRNHGLLAARPASAEGEAKVLHVLACCYLHVRVSERSGHYPGYFGRQRSRGRGGGRAVPPAGAPPKTPGDPGC